MDQNIYSQTCKLITINSDLWSRCGILKQAFLCVIFNLEFASDTKPQTPLYEPSSYWGGGLTSNIGARIRARLVIKEKYGFDNNNTSLMTVPVPLMEFMLVVSNCTTPDTLSVDQGLNWQSIDNAQVQISCVPCYCSIAAQILIRMKSILTLINSSKKQ